MLTPLEPFIDISSELSLSLPIDLPDKKYQYQGDFGNVFIETINDYYRPQRRPPPKPVSAAIRKSTVVVVHPRSIATIFLSFSCQFFIST